MTSDAPRRASGTILLAEDEPLLRELGETILTQAGYGVLTLTGVDAARKLMAEYAGTVDLLLTDVVMPEVSGTELAQMVKERWPAVRVLYMSGYADDELQDLERDAGFIQKPFTPAELMDKIREILSH